MSWLVCLLSLYLQDQLKIVPLLLWTFSLDRDLINSSLASLLQTLVTVFPISVLSRAKDTPVTSWLVVRIYIEKNNNSFITALKDTNLWHVYSSNDVNNVCYNILSNTLQSPGLDGISAKVITSSELVIAPVPVHIFMVCISKWCLPRCFKMAKVIPIFTHWSDGTPGNDRPIYSIVSRLNKLLEKVVDASNTSLIAVIVFMTTVA